MAKKLAINDMGNCARPNGELWSCQISLVFPASTLRGLRGTYEDDGDNREYQHDLPVYTLMSVLEFLQLLRGLR
jgi:hypothetical protein